ncbi:mitotic checkpoint serine/threonine-protein kinase BUB1 beta isoform X2 [Narcine bancroftii]|uniref:mitotic checkpoint serine/threonine-protein kinase BUB1 beta isoform X2 n=1 Tax=Narcine bancroftii TaxID=1343680 RepID=UPI003831B3F1
MVQCEGLTGGLLVKVVTLRMAEADWELSKENVQPLKQGRDVGTLKGVLAQHEGISQISIQEQKLAFEAEIRFYSGNDPLDVWDRYIKWTEQMFPHGGTDSNLSALLERSLELFLRNNRYYRDPRYLSHWLKFVDHCSDPLEVFDFLKSKGIGELHAAFYIAWAERYEILGNHRKAEAILQEGIQLRAEPLEKLQHHHRCFQSRIFKQVVDSINEGTNEELVAEPIQPQRTTLGDLKRCGPKKVLAPVNRIGSSLGSQSQRRHVVSIREQGTFEVFNENQLCNESADHLRFSEGHQTKLPSTSAKENEIKPARWNTSGMSRHSSMQSVPFSAALSASKPDFKLYEEESAHVETMTPRKIEPLFTPVLSARKPSKEANPLTRVQIQNCKEEKTVISMYSKDRVYAGLREFSFEELRAEELKKKYKSANEEQEQKLLKLKKESEEMEQLICKTKMAIKEKQEYIKLEAQQDELDIQTQLPRNLCVLTAQSESCTDKNADFSCSASLHPNFQNQAGDNVAQSGTAAWELGAQLNATEIKVKDSWKDVSNQDEMTLKNLNLSCDADVMNNLFHMPVACSQMDDENKPENLGTLSRVCNKNDLAYEALFMKNADRNDPSLVPKQMPSFSGLLPAQIPFKIFENADEDQENKLPADSLRTRPLPLSEILIPCKHIQTEGTCASECDYLDEFVPINECHFESNDYSNKTLGPFPENTCDFTRGAQLVSTPFHQNPLNDDQNKSVKWSCESTKNGLSSLSLFKESMRDQPLDLKVLSPIQEANEDGLSSATTTSSSGSSTSVGGHCPMNVFEKSEPDNPWDIEVRKQLLLSLEIPLSQLQEFHVQKGLVPTFEVGRELNLGSETFIIKQVVEHEECQVFYGSDTSLTTSKAIIKVYSHRVPWDFYINQQLKMRLGSEFNKYFSKNLSCYLFDNGCVTVDQDENSETLKDQFLMWESVPEVLIVYRTLNLLDLVEQLHTAEIVHGGISPETLFLGPWINTRTPMCPNGDNSVKLMDFAYSLDMRLQADVSSFTGFPTVHSIPNKQLPLECTSAYQIDLLGIADTVHVLLFGGHLDAFKKGSLWILSPTSYRLEFLFMKEWSIFFEKILNAGNEPSILTLNSLRQTMREAIEGNSEILRGILIIENILASNE